MPLYLFLTIFRVLSICFVIVALPFIWIPIYTFFALIAICIGYIWTSREEDFITRGLKSAFTSGFYSTEKQLDALLDAFNRHQKHCFILELVLCIKVVVVAYFRTSSQAG